MHNLTKQNTGSTVFTIGHSTRPFADFLTMLLSFQIEAVADVRSYPGSRWFPQFNKERMRTELAKHNIDYVHFKDLGGRKDTDGSPAKQNATSRKVSSFAGFAHHMQSGEYRNAEHKLEQLAYEKRTVFMCAEADWHKCHRSLIADSLLNKGWNVQHIVGVEKSETHALTVYATNV
jgi:uncharacterized protein (DUF488 family)